MITKEQGDTLYSLVKEIWGSKKKKGFNWIAAKFGRHYARALEQDIALIIKCLESKRDQVECLVHARVHDARP